MVVISWPFPSSVLCIRHCWVGTKDKGDGHGSSPAGAYHLEGKRGNYHHGAQKSGCWLNLALRCVTWESHLTTLVLSPYLWNGEEAPTCYLGRCENQGDEAQGILETRVLLEWSEVLAGEARVPVCLTPSEPRTQVESGMNTKEFSSLWVRFSRTLWV